MKTAVLAGSACLVVALTAPSAIPSSRVLLKDRAAMMIYQGRDSIVALLPQDTANIALIILSMSEGDSVAPSQLVDRPCIGLALFSNKEWTALMASGRRPRWGHRREQWLRHYSPTCTCIMFSIFG